MAHLVFADTQSRPFAKPKELEFFPPHGRQVLLPHSLCRFTTANAPAANNFFILKGTFT